MLRQDIVELPNKPNRRLAHIPGNYGLPLVGNTFDMLADPLKLLQSSQEKYGSVFRTSLFFRRAVTLLGPEANEMLMLDREQNFSSHWGWENTIGELFRNGLIARDFGDHRTHRRVMQAAFKKPVMETYLTILDKGIHDGVAELGPHNELQFYQLLKRLTLDMAAKVFLGDDIGQDEKQVREAFVSTVSAAAAIIRYPVPGLSWARGINARAWLDQFFRKLLMERREREGKDMFSVLCHAKTEEGESYSDDEIVDHMIFMMLAAHDTTTSALTSIGYALVSNPQIQEQAREEVLSLKKESFDYSDLDRLPYVDLVLKEALRMYPPVAAIPRRAINPFSFAGYDMPANTGLAIYPLHTHFMPEYWSDPGSFDPDRFTSQRAEHKQHNFLYLPFGGGAHMCLGMHFAVMQVKIMLFHLLKSYRITSVENYSPEFQIFPFPKPKDDLPVVLSAL